MCDDKRATSYPTTLSLFNSTRRIPVQDKDKEDHRGLFESFIINRNPPSQLAGLDEGFSNEWGYW